MKPIIYIEKSYRDRPSIFHELRRVMIARDIGTEFNPRHLFKSPGLRTASFAVTWAMLLEDHTPNMSDVISRPRTPRQAVKRDSNVSTRDGKPIGWNVKR